MLATMSLVLPSHDYLTLTYICLSVSYFIIHSTVLTPFLPAIMSAFILTGFLGVANNRRDSRLTKNRSGKEVRSYHTYYSTALHTAQGQSNEVELRVWNSSSDTFYPDDTILYTMAKMYAPPNQPFLLEAMHVAPVPGDPSLENISPRCP